MSTFTDAELARLRRYQAAHRRQLRHLREVHGIDVLASASRLEHHHQRAHWAEGTPWHVAWQPDPADDPDGDDGDAQEVDW